MCRPSWWNAPCSVRRGDASVKPIFQKEVTVRDEDLVLDIALE